MALQGASGQAVQCMNLMFGLPETMGLMQVPVLLRVVVPCRSTSTSSPGRIMRAPAGVPVRRMSPRSSVITCESSDTSRRKEKIRSDVWALVHS